MENTNTLKKVSEKASEIMGKVLSKSSGLVRFVKDKPVRKLVGLGLAGLVAVTALKDNVHFGSVVLHNPQENHYVWGLVPFVNIEGTETRGDIYNFGIVSKNELRQKSEHDGDLGAYGLVGGVNEVGEGSRVTGNLGTYGLVGGGNNFGEGSKVTGNLSAYGLVVGANSFEEGSRVTGNLGAYGLVGGGNSFRKDSEVTGNLDACGLLIGKNTFGEGSRVTGNLSAYGLVVGANSFGEGSRVTGNSSSLGVFSSNVDGEGWGRNVHIGLEDYVVSSEKENSADSK